MKILLADDDRDLVHLLRYAFQRDGYTVVTAFDGELATRSFQVESPDLVVLDLNMPRRSGMTVLQEIRRQGRVPVLILSSQNDEDHVVDALRIGADDYLTKPFRPRELKARVEALLRRSRENLQVTPKTSLPMSLGGIDLDPRTREVRVNERAVELTPTEFILLQYLMLNRGTVVSTSDILDNVWGYDAESGDEVVKVTISRLRRKVEADSSEPRYIVNVPGVGYRFGYDME